jgi:ParB family chromosome partitioning protein
MAAKSGLGKGLKALMSDAIEKQVVQTVSTDKPFTLDVTLIKPSPYQPRKHFDPDALSELSSSIKNHGVLQPLLVRKTDDSYELIAGERRFKAAGLAGLKEVPVIVLDVQDIEALEITMIENLQREELNPIEEAEGYLLLSEEFGMTQEAISERVGKSRATVANSMRLLALPAGVRRLVWDGTISVGHAKVLLSLEKPDLIDAFAAQIVRDKLSVRQLETEIKKAKRSTRSKNRVANDMPSSHLQYLSDELIKVLGTDVKLKSSKTLSNGKKSKGTIEISYYSDEDLSRILDLLGVRDL